MLRIETQNSTYLYDRDATTIVCVRGSNAGFSHMSADLETVVVGLPIQSRPGSDFYIRSTSVLKITQVEDGADWSPDQF